MNLESLKLELLHCLERAEEADRDDVRRSRFPLPRLGSRPSNRGHGSNTSR